MYITLEQAKKQLNIDDYFTLDDAQIERMIEAAEAIASKTLCRPLESFLIDGVLAPDVEHQVLLMVTNLYNNREPVTTGSLKEIDLSYNFINSLNKDYSK